MLRDSIISLRQRTHIISVMLLCLISTFYGCPFESKVPLESNSKARIDTNLIGVWRCTFPDADKPATMFILPFDEHQYYIEMQAEGEKSVRLRAYTTRIRNAQFLNVQEIDEINPPKTRSYMFFRYLVQEDGSLSIKIVEDKLFKGVKESPKAIVSIIERNIENPELYGEICTCLKIPQTKIDKE